MRWARSRSMPVRQAAARARLQQQRSGLCSLVFCCIVQHALILIGRIPTVGICFAQQQNCKSGCGFRAVRILKPTDTYEWNLRGSREHHNDDALSPCPAPRQPKPGQQLPADRTGQPGHGYYSRTGRPVTTQSTVPQSTVTVDHGSTVTVKTTPTPPFCIWKSDGNPVISSKMKPPSGKASSTWNSTSKSLLLFSATSSYEAPASLRV